MYVVRWLRSARDDLAHLWLQAGSGERAAITRAAHEIERALRRDPGQAGESRASGRRILFSAPLVILFRIDGQTVSVLEVDRYGAVPG